MSGRGVLRRTQLVLLLLLVALALVRRGEHFWPIVTWPVYSLIKPEFPAPTKTLLEARVTTTSREKHVLRSADLIEWSRHAIADLVLEGAAAGDRDAGRRAADRAHLARLIALALGHEKFEAIEIWSVEWQVEPLVRPPLLRATPRAETQRAEFARPTRSPQ